MGWKIDEKLEGKDRIHKWPRMKTVQGLDGVFKLVKSAAATIPLLYAKGMGAYRQGFIFMY